MNTAGLGKLYVLIPRKIQNIYFVISCRPLSKTVRFNVLKVIPAGSSGGGKKAFTGI